MYIIEGQNMITITDVYKYKITYIHNFNII